MKFAIIGNGFIGQRHIDAIRATGGEVAAVCDIDEYKKQEAIPFFTDYKEAIADADAVSICTPNNLHVPMALYCLRQGKRVLSEKPLGLSSREISKLPDNGSIFSVLQLRYHPEVRQLKESVDNGGFYEVEMKIVVRRDKPYWDGWKGDTARSGGILMNIGIHYFDLLVHLFGTNYAIKEARHDDTSAEGVISFPNARVAYHLGIIADSNGQDRLISINGKETSLSKQDNLSSEDLHVHVYRDFLTGKGILPKEAVLSVKLVEELMGFNNVPRKDQLVASELLEAH